MARPGLYEYHEARDDLDEATRALVEAHAMALYGGEVRYLGDEPAGNDVGDRDAKHVAIAKFFDESPHRSNVRTRN